MGTLTGKTAFITGGSRGIGREIALRFAREGANVVLAAKTSDPHPKLSGTIHSVAEEARALGVRALPVQVDVRVEESVQAAVDAAVAEFGGIDILVNNAGAIQLSPVQDLSIKKLDLMMGINVRAVFVCTKLCLPHLQASAKKGHHPHVLSLSPPPRIEKRWLTGTSAYTMTKFGMSMLTIGFAEELRDDGIAVNALWPRSIISTAAVEMLLGDDGEKHARTAAIMADAAYEIVKTPALGVTGSCLIDEEFLITRGHANFDRYQCRPGEELWPDFYVDGYGEGAIKSLA